MPTSTKRALDYIRCLSPAKIVFWAGLGVVAISLFSLGAALTAQYGFNMQPCILCLYQRFPYAFTALLGLASLFLGRRSFNAGLGALVPVVPLFLTGAGIGVFQVGVEKNWWRGTEKCSGPVLDPSLSPEALLAKIQAAPLVRCDVVQFELFGLSMAAYNAMMSLGLAVILAAALVYAVRKRPA